MDSIHDQIRIIFRTTPRTNGTNGSWVFHDPDNTVVAVRPQVLRKVIVNGGLEHFGISRTIPRSRVTFAWYWTTDHDLRIIDGHFLLFGYQRILFLL